MRANFLGIDLGTANTLVFAKGRGVVLSEPSVVAFNTSTKKVLAVGNEAKEMIGRTPGNISAVRPLRDGVIADFETTSAMLSAFIKKARKICKYFRRPNIIVCVPSGVTEVEKRAIEDAITKSKSASRVVSLIEEPMAAAIGAGVKVTEPRGGMIVDIGGGTSEIAVISLGGIVSSKSLNIAGDDMDASIVSFVRREFGLAIGDRTAEDIKLTVGCAHSPDASATMEVRGRDLVSGLPRTVILSEVDGQRAIAEPIDKIIDAIRHTLEHTPPELASDVMEAGIALAGGGALIKGLDTLVERETGIETRVADNPLHCVVIGTGLVIEHDQQLRGVLVSRGRNKW